MKWQFWKKSNPENSVTLTDSEARYLFGVVSSASGVTVNEKTALTQGAVYACVQVLANTIASLPVKVYRKSGDTREAIDHPLNNLLSLSCNGEQTSYELREFQMTCLGLRGNAYAQKLFNNRGEIAEINPLLVQHMNVDRDKTGKLVFDYQESGRSRVFAEKDIWRIAGLGSNGVTGLSPIALARETIGTAIALEGHGANTINNGVSPSMVLSHPGELGDKAFERLKEQIENKKAGIGNAGKPFLVEGGMQAHVVGMTNQDAQFIESRKFQAEEVARWYRVPPHMIGLLDKATFSNIEQQSIDFVRNTVRPWLSRIEATMRRDLLSESEKKTLYVEHSVEGLLRGDTKARYEAYASGIDKGWLSRNEVRKLENKQPIDGLDELVLPVNVETISEREKRFEKNMAQLLANQEVNGLKAEIKKGDTESIADFYSRFSTKLIENGVSEDSATDYVLTRCDQVKQKQIEKIERSAQSDIRELL